LPRTPIKKSEHRGARFEQRFGEGATELDALEAKHPGEFARIVRNEIERYWNSSHDSQVSDAFDEFENGLNTVEAAVYAEHQDALDGFKAEIAALNSQSGALNKQAAELRGRMRPIWSMMADELEKQRPTVDITCPEFAADEDDNPLFDSTRDYVEQVDAYKGFQGKRTTRKPRTVRPKTRQRIILRRPQ
jgi:hypothetical protein